MERSYRHPVLAAVCADYDTESVLGQRYTAAIHRLETAERGLAAATQTLTKRAADVRHDLDNGLRTDGSWVAQASENLVRYAADRQAAVDEMMALQTLAHELGLGADIVPHL